MSGGLDKAGEINRDYILCDVVGHAKVFDLYLKNSGKPLKGSSKSGVM